VSDLAYVDHLDGTITLEQALSYFDQATGAVIYVPAGFTCDLASVPQFFQSIVPKWGKLNRAAIIHDWLYRHQGKPASPFTLCLARAECDRIFRDIMKADGVSFWTRWDAWLGVRLGGWAAWDAKRPSDA
jgi:hypothetical protein